MFLNKNSSRLFKILIIIGGLIAVGYGLKPFIGVKLLNNKLDHWYEEYSNPFQDKFQVQNVQLRIEASAIDPQECEIGFLAYVKSVSSKEYTDKDKKEFYEAVRPRIAEGCAQRGIIGDKFTPQYKKVADYKAEFLTLGSVGKGEPRKEVVHEVMNKAIIMAAYAPDPSRCRATGLATLLLLKQENLDPFEALYVADDKVKEFCLPGKE